MKRLILPTILALFLASIVLVSCGEEFVDTETYGEDYETEENVTTKTTTTAAPVPTWQVAPTTTTTKPTTTTKKTAPTKKVIKTLAANATTKAATTTTARPTPPPSAGGSNGAPSISSSVVTDPEKFGEITQQPNNPSQVTPNTPDVEIPEVLETPPVSPDKVPASSSGASLDKDTTNETPKIDF